MKWLRHDSEIDDHPDVIFAGFYGARIAEALCRTSKKFDLGGVVPSKYATALYLSRQLGLDIDLCRKGLEDASRVNPYAEEGEPPLIVRDACGNVTIPGWDKINGDREIENIREKARARKERYKERHKNAVEQEKNVPGTFPNVPERDGTKGTGDGTGRDGTLRDDPVSSATHSHPADKSDRGVEVVPQKGMEKAKRAKGVPPSRMPAVLTAFAYWMKTCNHPGCNNPSPESLIARRIDAYLQSDGMAAFESVCRGAVLDPWEGRCNQDTPDILLREGNVLKFRKLDSDGSVAKPVYESSAVRMARKMGILDETTGRLSGD